MSENSTLVISAPEILWLFVTHHLDSNVTGSLSRLLCPWDFPGKNTGVGCHFHLQGLFPTQGLNPCLLHWQAIFFTNKPATRETKVKGSTLNNMGVSFKSIEGLTRKI